MAALKSKELENEVKKRRLMAAAELMRSVLTDEGRAVGASGCKC